MTPRENLLKLFRNEKPDHVPWFGDLAYWIDYLMDEKLMPKKYQQAEYGAKQASVNQGLAQPFIGKGLHRLHEDLQVGFYLQGYFPFETIFDLQVEVEMNGDKKTTIFKTPFGNLTEVWKYIYETHSWGPAKHLISDYTELKALRFVYEHTHYKENYELAQKRCVDVGQNGVVLVYTPKSPLMELVALKSGIENVTYMFLDAQEEFEETLQTIEKRHDEATNISLASPAECVMTPDNLSSEVVGGMFFDRYIKPVHQKWVGQIAAAHKVSFVHLDGTLNPLLTQLSEIGWNVIEAVTPQPAGDIALEDLRKYVKEETIIWGGIPGGFFTNQISDEEFDAFVIRALKVMKNNNRFVLGVADQVVPGSSFERVARVAWLVERYGKYDT